MAGKLSTDKILQAFSGEGDVLAWIAKVELVSKLTGVKDLSSFIPLYLEGSALSLYLELPDEKKNDADVLKRELVVAFTDGQVVSFCKLKGTRWSGESVDVYANEIRKLAKGCGFDKEGLEQAVKLAFVAGFPDHISVELQTVQNFESVSTSDLINRARVLTANMGKGSVVAAGQTSREQRSCYGCGGPHMVRNCPTRAKELKCFRCGGNHMIRFCPQMGKETNRNGASCVGTRLQTVGSQLRGVPVVQVMVNGRLAHALVDTGCTTTMVHDKLVDSAKGEAVMVAFDGREVVCKGMMWVNLQIGEKVISQEVTVVENIVKGVEVVLGMDVIGRLGGIQVKNGEVEFGTCAMTKNTKRPVPDITDRDFEAFFDGKSWEVRYFWNDSGPPELKNRVGEYGNNLSPEKLKSYEEEVERWIKEGILLPWNGEVGGVLPLIAVDQSTKGKVRPVLDFRELNKGVKCHTGDEMTDVCGERLREWRMMEGEGEIVDLKSAYLQIRVAKELWKYQLVKFKGKVYCLTRLGFGLSSAPRIMTKILKTVLAEREDIKNATSSYIDDIMIDISRVPTSEVVIHLEKKGLKAKQPETLEGGAVLGLKLHRSLDGSLRFSRANEIPNVGNKLTRRELFSICGKLIGHYPKAGWLRVACSFLKRHATGASWGDYVGDEIRDRMKEVVEEVRVNDPVKGVWNAPKSSAGTVWCDASDLAMGVVLEIGGEEVEDATWMRKKEDFNHINVAELEAIMKGINMCAKWGLNEVTVKTDSATVCNWLKLTISEERRVRTKGAAEMLVKRRLGIFKSMIHELNMNISVVLVKSGENKADSLTRVKKRWLMKRDHAMSAIEDVKTLHDKHHMGVERSWYLAKKIDESVGKDDVKSVVKNCDKCQSIDPAPVSHTHGELGVDHVWGRLAIDVTHFRGLPYLTMVDCGPGRLVIWKELRGETASEISRTLDILFYERCPVAAILMDNAPAFHSREMGELCGKWGIRPFYRAAYRASGNGIVERSHRTIKSMAEKSGKSPIDAVFWYNMSPRYGQRDDSVPQMSVFKYEWSMPGGQCGNDQSQSSEIHVGDEVWVKPGNAKCWTQWDKKTVTKVNSANNIEVDGMPRHVLDIRPVITLGEDEGDEGSEGNEIVEKRYPQRDRTDPVWMRDYVR